MYSVLINLLVLLTVAFLAGAYIKYCKLREHSDDWKNIVEE